MQLKVNLGSHMKTDTDNLQLDETLLRNNTPVTYSPMKTMENVESSKIFMLRDHPNDQSQ